jgi:hypothetical protein
MTTCTLSSAAAVGLAPESTTRTRPRRSPWVVSHIGPRRSPWIVSLIRTVLLALVLGQLAVGLYSFLRSAAVSLQGELASAAETTR